MFRSFPRLLILCAVFFILAENATCSSSSWSSDAGQQIMETIVTKDQCPSPKSVFSCNHCDGALAACAESEVISINSYGFVKAFETASQCPYPISVSRSTSTGIIYAACFGETAGSGGVVNIDYGPISMSANSSQCSNPRDVFAFKDDTYVACSNHGITKINWKMAPILVLADAIQCPQAISVTVDADTGVVYAGCAGKSGGIISISNGTIKKIVTLSSCPIPSDLSAVGGTLYATCSEGASSVIAIDLDKTTITSLATQSQCASPQSMSVDSADNTVYVACNDGVIAIRNGNISVLIDSSQCEGPSSVSVSMSREGKKVMYVTCFDDEENSVIRVSVDYPFIFSPVPKRSIVDTLIGMIGRLYKRLGM
jgi:hypothetical protein